MTDEQFIKIGRINADVDGEYHVNDRDYEKKSHGNVNDYVVL